MKTKSDMPTSLKSATRLLGEVISWTCSGVSVTYPSLIEALAAARLDPAVARELAPRHAFTRACKRLSDQRIIRQVAEDETTLQFQFTAEHKEGATYAYELETMLTLNKQSGSVSCGLVGLATIAQEELDRCIAARTGSDVTRVIQKLFDRHADLFPVREAGGVYFVPARHSTFVDQVQGFLGRINGRVARFPVPAGTPEGDRSVKESVAAGLTAIIDEYRAAVAEFDTDTRKGTVERAAARIRATKFKVEAYAELLAEEKARLERSLADAQKELRAKIESLATTPVGA